jgi:hypothetical protein
MSEGPGYFYCLGTCWGCGGLFMFNPTLVPSLPVNGVREPICEVCFHHGNAIRAEQNLEPWPPFSPGAYQPAPVADL